MDRAGKVLAVLVGQPQSLDYAESAREVYRAMSDAASQEIFKPDEKNHRRGDFPVLNLGVTFPLGGRSPTNLNAGGHERAAAELVIEFPLGSLILIPSATLTHSNLPVGEGECRASFTQYCGGNLFRYIDNGFRTEKQFAKEDPLGYRQMCALKASRWQEGLDLLSNISEFRVEEAKGSNDLLLA